MNHTESYIDNSIVITEELPICITSITDRMEELDKENTDAYFDLIDDFWVVCKNCCVDGVISDYTKKLLERKYMVKAYKVAKRESEEEKSWQDRQNLTSM